jgi:metal-responsive CopG/Arc/MetJ family transcriptional regulator
MEEAMSAIRKIAISLPSELVSDLERIRKQTGETRSAFIRRALELAMAERKQRVQIARYLEGYRKHPETAKEIKAAEAAATALLAEEPWE